MSDHFSILVVEDDPVSRKLLVKILRQSDYHVLEAEDGLQAWELLQQEPIQMVITDWLMPRMDGVALTRKIRSADLPGYVYIVILTGLESVDHIVDGLDAGADDYLTKPYDPKELHARLRIGTRVLELERRLKQAYEKMRRLAMCDELTGLWNRRAFYAFAIDELERCSRFGRGLCLILLDIDHFKQVNDRFGHLMGDRALQMVADVIRENLRAYDRAGRWGGEEFVILLPETTLAVALKVAERLRAAVENARLDVSPFLGEEADAVLQVQISLGVAYAAGGDALSLDALVGRADDALYRAKEMGRNRVCAEGVR